MPLPILLYTLMVNMKHTCIFSYVIPVEHMWSDIIHEFADSPSQGRVVRFLLENGFGVNDEGRICCNGIEIPATSVAKAIGSDRRVVDSTARRILERPFLREIFLNMRATPDLTGLQNPWASRLLSSCRRMQASAGLSVLRSGCLQNIRFRSGRSLSPIPSSPRIRSW